MKRLDRYVLGTFARTGLLALAAFAGLYLLVDFFEKVDNFLDQQAQPIHYLIYFSGKVPMIIVQVLPLAILMGVFMTLGGFSRTSELTAMRASGIGLWRISTPLLSAAAAAALFMLLASEFLVPVTTRAVQHVYEVEVKGKSNALMKQENIWFREGDAIIHVRFAFPDQNRLEGISIYQVDAGFNLVARTDARQAIYRQGHWLLQQATVQRFDPRTDELSAREQRAEMPAVLRKSPEDFTVPPEKNLEMGIRDLERLIDRLQSEGYDATRYRVDLQSRLATPFACIILAFLGIPFALQRGRSANLATGMAISVAIGVSYFIIQSMLQAFGYSAVLPPVVAAWAANLLFGMLGVWLLLSARQ